jgi:SWI/SNF-related matrix-associated actin-dependent regulator 1 of chromatin subfamily A
MIIRYLAPNGNRPAAYVADATGAPRAAIRTLVEAGFAETVLNEPGRRQFVTTSVWGAAAVVLAGATPDAATRAHVAPILARYEMSIAQDGLDEYPAPPGLSYLPFQRAGIQFASARRTALIADEMGLGKTVQALGVVNAVGARSVLILCPASIRLQWLAQARLWLLDGQRRVMQVLLNGSDKIMTRAEIIISSYDLVRSPAIRAALLDRRYDVLILDEAHYLKNHSSGRARAVLGAYTKTRDPAIIDRAERILALTGTPVPNRPRELYTLLRALDWSAIDRMSEDEFRETYNPTRSRGGRTFDYALRPRELQMRLRGSVMIRRLKAEVAKELPEKTYSIIELSPDARVQRVLDQERRFHELDVTKIKSWPVEERSALAAVRREMGIAKLPLVAPHIEMLLAGGLDKLVVFTWHVEVARGLAELLRRTGRRCSVLVGATPPAERARLIEEFVTEPSVQVFVAQMLTGGVGVDGLQKVCSFALFAEPSWTFGDNEQAAARLHRAGQASPVTVQFTVASGSLDAIVLGAALAKAKTADAVLDRR